MWYTVSIPMQVGSPGCCPVPLCWCWMWCEEWGRGRLDTTSLCLPVSACSCSTFHCLHPTSGPSQGKIMCYGVVDGQRMRPPEGMFGGGSGGPPEFFWNFEAKPLLLGTFHSVPSSAAKLLSQQAYKLSQHWQSDNKNILEVFSAV